ncbi:MAG: hypothetical protein IBJ11_07115 [Phycisphaerales bacterium]|nr:hypothetical protein [Phycisphaerales bacterium]
MASACDVTIERGTAHVLFAYDVGLGVELTKAERLLETGGLGAGGAQREHLEHRRRAPEYLAFDPPPLKVMLPVEAPEAGGRRLAPIADCVVYDFGAVSIGFEMPLDGPFDGLVGVAAALYRNEPLQRASRAVLDRLLGRIGPAVSKPRVSGFFEDYVIYELLALRDGLGGPVTGDRLLAAHAGLAARILRAEPGAMSDQEVGEASAQRLSYGGPDVCMIDWNAALLIDPDGADVRSVLEFANVELLEMRHLDDQLDDILDQSHDLLTERTWTQLFRWRGEAAKLRRLADLQSDSVLLFEGVNNAIKLLGDQYLARVYRAAATRLHLPEWDASILRKISTLESIQDKFNAFQTTRRMELLEWMIIALFVVSIIQAAVMK